MTKLKAFKFAMIVFACATFPVQAQQSSQVPLTNAAVVKLVRAGFKEKTIIAIVRNRPSRFNLEPERLIELKRSGVSENIILAMLAQDDSFALDAEDWSAESTLRGNSNRNAEADGASNGSDIFGSGSRSRSQTSGRGLDGAGQLETTTTGSATVRILRPPAEAGGGSPVKLEKTPTLNNEAVVELVEAGFSEGTIIKRIEDSPADFDLSSTKLQELRKRRVSEKILSAMTAAMADDAPTGRSKGN
ncbi:MAG: hypothetical protein QOD33_1524 [Pyrinomonadaceae bacterium]|nr:hypothetical protein [Pyrinomonadaceae bacterium]